jgi:ribose 5-phosphate isomerase A
LEQDRPQSRQELALETRVLESEKEAAAVAAAELVRPGMRVGLGTGTTVAHLIPALARRGLKGVRYAASSPRTEQLAKAAGLPVFGLEEFNGQLDLTIDGADQVDRSGWLIKGGGGAHTREKILAAAAERFVVIVSANKIRDRLQPPVPLEVLPFAFPYVAAALGELQLRGGPPSPDGNLICDYLGPIGDTERLAERLAATPGVVEHGLFPPSLVSEVVVGIHNGVERHSGGKNG